MTDKSQDITIYFPNREDTALWQLPQQIDEVVELFQFIDNWEERYEALIQYGRKLPIFPEPLKSNRHIVKGCTSQVWLVPHKSADDTLRFIATSDSVILRGLIALLFVVYYDMSMDKVSGYDIDGLFEKLGLQQNLMPNRRSGFYAMVTHLKNFSHASSKSLFIYLLIHHGACVLPFFG